MSDPIAFPNQVRFSLIANGTDSTIDPKQIVVTVSAENVEDLLLKKGSPRHEREAALSFLEMRLQAGFREKSRSAEEANPITQDQLNFLKGIAEFGVEQRLRMKPQFKGVNINESLFRDYVTSDIDEAKRLIQLVLNPPNAAFRVINFDTQCRSDKDQSRKVDLNFEEFVSGKYRQSLRKFLRVCEVREPTTKK